MNFRKAQVTDLPILNTISVLSKQHWGYPESWMAQWKNDLTLDKKEFSAQQVLLVENKNQIVGFCSIAENPKTYEILHLWLLPEFIGKGHGKKLLQTAIQSFVKKEYPIIVEADPHAEAFYKSQGFETYDKVESFPPGRFLPVMKKPYEASSYQV